MRVVDVSSDLFTSHRWNGFLEQLGAQFSPFFILFKEFLFKRRRQKESRERLLIWTVVVFGGVVSLLNFAVPANDSS